MASKTFLETVNAVLLRLRETEVSTWDQTTYSKMIGGFVNDARDYVEGRYEWIGLEEILPITTADGTDEYALTGAGDQARITKVVDDTNNIELKWMNNDDMQREKLIVTADNDAPTRWTISGYNSARDPLLTFYHTPNGAYTIQVFTDKTGVELTDDSDTLAVPFNPVKQLALALARGERGETGGATDLNTFPLADIYIQNAIQAEASKRPDDQMWEVEGEMPSRTNWAQ